MLKKFTNRAFTLAEVLITLAIIGTIAAMTVPSLVQRIDIDRKQAEIGVKKNISVLDGATKQIIMLQTSGMNLKKMTCADTNKAQQCLIDNYKKYIQYAKICTSTSTDDACKTIIKNFPNCPEVLITTDGSAIAVYYWGMTATGPTNMLIEYQGTMSNPQGAGHIGIDVNGAKKPNKEGRDIFYVPLLNTGLKIKNN